MLEGKARKQTIKMSVVFHLVTWKVYSYFAAFSESDMCLLWI